MDTAADKQQHNITTTPPSGTQTSQLQPHISILLQPHHLRREGMSHRWKNAPTLAVSSAEGAGSRSPTPSVGKTQIAPRRLVGSRGVGPSLGDSHPLPTKESPNNARSPTLPRLYPVAPSRLKSTSATMSSHPDTKNRRTVTTEGLAGDLGPSVAWLVPHIYILRSICLGCELSPSTRGTGRFQDPTRETSLETRPRRCKKKGLALRESERRGLRREGGRAGLPTSFSRRLWPPSGCTWCRSPRIPGGKERQARTCTNRRSR